MRRAALLGLWWVGGCTCTAPRTDIPHAEPRTDIPVYRAPRATTPPNLDGRLDDEAWTDAPPTEPFVHTVNGEPGDPHTTARVAWDATHLYVAFEVSDGYLRSEFPPGPDPHLWEQDTVEIMVDPDGDGENYFEMQLSPGERVFDTRFDRRRVPQPFGHTGWSSELRGAVALNGTLNDDERDQGYVAEMAIPWRSFATGQMPSRPPTAGVEWRVALYVLDARPGGQAGVGWSPPLVGDFHVPDRFGRVVFEGDE